MPPDGGGVCPQCRLASARAWRANNPEKIRAKIRNETVSGYHAEVSIRWWHRHAQDPDFKAKRAERMREYRKRPDVQMARRLGITPKAARAILERRDG